MPGFLVTGRHSPVRADWSILSGSPYSSRASAAELDAYVVPWDEDCRVVVAPPAVTDVLGARLAMSSLAALPALFSSQNEMVELMRRSATMPTKSCHHWLARWPSRLLAITAAASITHDSGFHMNPRNLSTLLSCKQNIQLHGANIHIHNGKKKAELMDQHV